MNHKRIISCPYQILSGEPGLLPLCNLQLIGPNGSVLVKALVDSGADFTVFPTKAAEDAGINLAKAANQWLQYGGSTESGRKTNVLMFLDGRHWRAEVVFVERNPFRYALLGRHGVFRQFNEIAFMEKSRTPRVEFRYYVGFRH